MSYGTVVRLFSDIMVSHEELLTSTSFLGYSNEVGEALRPVIPKKIVHLSYGIAVTYVIADCIDKSMKTYKVISRIKFYLKKSCI